MRRGFVNGRLADGRVVDVVVDDDRITEVVPHGSVDLGDLERTDLGGWLVVAPMVEPHAHLDKALTAEVVPNPTGDLLGAIDAWTAAAERGTFTHDDIVRRVRLALEKLLLNGVIAV
jgi:cytosine/creatinine deaminase